MNPDLAAKIETFRTKAQQQGISPEKIDAFIAQKTGQTSPAALPQTTPQTAMPQIGLPQAGNFQLSPQQVMAAQLFLPAEQAEALKSAYDIQLKTQEQQQKQQTEQKKEQQALALKNRTLQAAQDLATTKFGGITGVRSIGSFLPGTREQEARAAFDQLKGLLTLENVSYLKGTGALSDREMGILERASTKLNTNLSDKAFERELNALITELGGTPAIQEESKKKIEATSLQPTGTPLDTVLQAAQTQPAQPQQTLQPQQREKDLLDTVISILPAAGGILGGLAGGAAGSIAGGVGAIPGSAGGTFIGAAGGRQLAEIVQNLTNRQDETTTEAYKESLIDAGKAATADLVTGGLIKIGSPILKGVASKLINVGDDLALRALKPTKTQQRNFLAKTGQELKDFVIKKGLFEQGTEQVDELIKPLQQNFDNIASRSKVQIPTGDIANAFKTKIQELNNSGIAGYQSIARSLQNQSDAFLQKFGNTLEIDISEINKLRKGLDVLISDSAFTKDSIEAGADKLTRDIYVNIVRNAADNAGLVDDAGRSLKDIGQELGKLYSFKDIAATQKYLGTGTLPIGLTRTIGLAGTGGVVGGLGGQGDPKAIVTGALLSLGLPSVANNPKVIAILANQLPKIGAAINAIPENQKAKLATDMIRRLLTQIGASEITDLGQELAGIE